MELLLGVFHFKFLLLLLTIKEHQFHLFWLKLFLASALLTGALQVGAFLAGALLRTRQVNVFVMRHALQSGI
jgi:hypothetical protein